MKHHHKMIVVVVALVSLCSCGKEDPRPNQETRIDIKPNGSVTLRGGGDDDEEPAVQGIVSDTESNPVNGVLVELVPDGETTATDSDTTDISGSYEVSGPDGNYFIRLTPVGQSSTNSATFLLEEDETMNFTI